MRIKDKELRRKLRPIFRDATNKVHHQERLSNELMCRLRWQNNVILLCDNRDEFIKAFGLAKLKYVIFPSRRRLPKDIIIRYYPEYSRPRFHIIRQGKHKLRVVKYKLKEEKAADTPVNADKVRCGDIVKALDNSLVQIHHIGEHGEVHYIAFADKYYGEMQRAPYRYTYGYITQFYTATIKEKIWLRKWIKQCKAGKIGYWI